MQRLLGRTPPRLEPKVSDLGSQRAPLLTFMSASRVFGNNWQTQPRTILSMARNDTRLGLPRRSTMICCRNTRISASNVARGRNKSTTIPKIILQRSNIPQRITRFCVSRQLDGIYGRDKCSHTDSNVTPVGVPGLLSVKRQHSQHRSDAGAVAEVREGQADRSVVLISMFDPSV